MPLKKIDTERQKLIDTMLNALEAPYKKLTPWEEDFVASVSDQFQTRKDLSDRQIEVLDRIYTEKTN